MNIKQNDTFTAILSKLSKDHLFRFCKNFFYFLLSNGVFFLILLIIYQNIERALYIFLGLLLGSAISNLLGLPLHSLTLHICKKRNKNFDYKFINYTKSEVFGFACTIIVILFCIIRIIIKEMLAPNLIFTSMILAILFLIIGTIITSFTTAKELHFKGLLGTIIRYNTIINYEFVLSARIKKNINSKLLRGNVVKTMNLVNLTFSSFISIVYVCMAPIVLQYSNKTSADNYFFWFIILPSLPIVARTITRSTEIMIAFFIDTIDKNKKQTTIQPHERVLLAIYSLIEITLLFASVYFFIEMCSFFSVTPNMREILYRNFDNTYFFFYSFGITTYKSVEFKGLGNTHSLAIVLQIITSMVLILFTFARYIGEIKEIKNKRNKVSRKRPYPYNPKD